MFLLECVRIHKPKCCHHYFSYFPFTAYQRRHHLEQILCCVLPLHMDILSSIAYQHYLAYPITEQQTSIRGEGNG